MALTSMLTYLVILASIWPTSSTDALTVEEQLQQLRDNYMEMRQALTAKDSQLEALQKQNDEMRQVLNTKVTQLEAMDARLESLMKLKDQQHYPPGFYIDSYSREIDYQSTGKSAILRTCREIRAADPSLSSGMHWIDPDGQGVGDAPIYVYCDMTSGSTSVLHDSESPTDVGHCLDPGCYTRAVNYTATNRQMTALAELSSQCHQSLKYDCNYAPFELNDVVYAWWNDKNGNPQYFWSGKNASVHTCQCGIDHNCLEASTTCNCDSTLPIPQADSGAITDKNLLPIIRLSFGRTLLETSSGVHTLGRFECSGQVAVNGMPTSCKDLWSVGHTLSGLYSVMGASMVESVYCDFTKLPGDADFQKWIGFVDVKSSPTYFYVQNTAGFNQTTTPIPFNREVLNVGGAMNLQSGKFTAPRTGKYFFSFSGKASFPGKSTRLYIYISLHVNGNLISYSHADEISAGNQFEAFSLQSTLNLKAGDQIWLEIPDISPGVLMWGGSYNHFTGWLLDEVIFPVSANSMN